MATQELRSSAENSPQQNLEALRNNAYPGRGIVMGYDGSGEHALQVYWIMGRSENSRNRVFVHDGDTVRTAPFDESKVQDPSLIIYNAMREVNGVHIVTNGDQTDTIADAVARGTNGTFGLGVRSYEPDEPNFTPRISGVFVPTNTLQPFTFSKISRRSVEDPQAVHNFFHSSPKAELGVGRCFHTYEGDGNPLPSFRGNPYPVSLTGSLDDIVEMYWDSLNAENRVSLAAKSIDLKTGMSAVRIINKFQ